MSEIDAEKAEKTDSVRISVDTKSDATKKHTLQITSTNDLRCSYFHVGIQGFSNSIQIFQFVLFVVVVATNPGWKQEVSSGQVALGKAFIFLHFCFNVPTSLCNYTRLRMRLFYSDPSDGFADLLVRQEVGDSVVAATLSNMAALARMTCGLLKSSAILFGYNFTELDGKPDKIMFGKTESTLQKFLRFSGYGLEQMNIFMQILALVCIMNQQTDLVNMVFNFSAILIIAELDEMIIKTFPVREVEVNVPADFKEEHLRFDKSSCEMGEFGYVGLVTSLLFAATSA